MSLRPRNCGTSLSTLPPFHLPPSQSLGHTPPPGGHHCPQEARVRARPRLPTHVPLAPTSGSCAASLPRAAPPCRKLKREVRPQDFLHHSIPSPPSSISSPVGRPGGGFDHFGPEAPSPSRTRAGHRLDGKQATASLGLECWGVSAMSRIVVFMGPGRWAPHHPASTASSQQHGAGPSLHPQPSADRSIAPRPPRPLCCVPAPRSCRHHAAPPPPGSRGPRDGRRDARGPRRRRQRQPLLVHLRPPQVPLR